MQMPRWISASLILILLMLIGNRHAFASPQVWVSRSGSNTWTVYGQGLENIGGIFLSINYEKTLVSPSVNNGSVVSGALATSNTATPGVIRFAAVSPNPFSKSSGDIATVTFGGGNGKVTGISSEMATANDNNPQKVAVIADVRDSGDLTNTTAGQSAGASTDTSSSGQTPSGSNTSTNTTSGTTATVASSSGQSTWLGGVSIQSGDSASVDTSSQTRQTVTPVETARVEQPVEVAKEIERSQPEPESKPVEDKKTKPAKLVTSISVLDRFKEYKGERSPKEMLALFVTAPVGYKQIPAVFLADGKAVVKITIPVDPAASASPNFAMSKEAKMASFPKIEEDIWVIQLKPNKGVYQATLLYSLDELMADIPVTVAPALETYNGKPFSKMTESDLVQFLKKAEGKPEAAKDLNGDEAVDYIDDYIFIANFLVQADQSKVSLEKKEEPKVQPATKAPEVPAKKTGK